MTPRVDRRRSPRVVLFARAHDLLSSHRETFGRASTEGILHLDDDRVLALAVTRRSR